MEVTKRGIIFSTREELVRWMSSNGFEERIQTHSRIRYYKRSNSDIISVEHHKKKGFEVRRKILKPGGYLEYCDGSSRTSFKVGGCNSDNNINSNRNSNPSAISYKQAQWYSQAFSHVVYYLTKRGIPATDAQDYAQDAFLKICDGTIKEKDITQTRFIAIWKRRGWWDYLECRSRACILNRQCDMPFIPVWDKPIELRLGNLLSAPKEREVVNNILSGFSITDIAELTGRSFASLSCARNRAVASLKKMKI